MTAPAADKYPGSGRLWLRNPGLGSPGVEVNIWALWVKRTYFNPLLYLILVLGGKTPTRTYYVKMTTSSSPYPMGGAGRLASGMAPPRPMDPAPHPRTPGIRTPGRPCDRERSATKGPQVQSGRSVTPRSLSAS